MNVRYGLREYECTLTATVGKEEFSEQFRILAGEDGDALSRAFARSREFVDRGNGRVRDYTLKVVPE